MVIEMENFALATTRSTVVTCSWNPDTKRTSQVGAPGKPICRIAFSVSKSRTGHTHFPAPMYRSTQCGTSTCCVTYFCTRRNIIISKASFSTR